MSTPPLNPTSFRFPFEISGKAAPEIEQALRYHSQGLLDLNNAIVALKNQQTASGSTVINQGSESLNQTINNISSVGGINDQTGHTAYTTQTTDNGLFLILGDASPVAVTLSVGIPTPWFVVAANLGTSTATLTPVSGTINGGASLTLPSGSFADIAFNGTNFIALTPASSGSGYSLGGAISSGNVALGVGAGTGAIVNAVYGQDGNHIVQITTGTTPSASGTIYTLTYTASRGRVSYPVLSADALGQYTALAQVPHFTTQLATSYVFAAATTALTASTSYLFTVSAP